MSRVGLISDLLPSSRLWPRLDCLRLEDSDSVDYEGRPCTAGALWLEVVDVEHQLHRVLRGLIDVLHWLVVDEEGDIAGSPDRCVVVPFADVDVGFVVVRSSRLAGSLNGCTSTPT